MSDLNEENSNLSKSEFSNSKTHLFSTKHEVRQPQAESNNLPNGNSNPLLYNFSHNDQHANISNYEESHTFPIFSGSDDVQDSSLQTRAPNYIPQTTNNLNSAPSDFPNYNDLMHFPSVDDMPGAGIHEYENNFHGIDENNRIVSTSPQDYSDYPTDFLDNQNGLIYQRNYFNPERRMSQDMERNAFYRPNNYNTQPTAPKESVRPLYYFDEYDANFGRTKKREKVTESSFAASEYAHRYCYICSMNGRMIVCQQCNSVAHLKCAKLKRASEQGWICKPCMVKINKDALKYKEVLNSVNKGGQDLNTADVHLFKDEMILALDIPIELENLLIRLSNIEQTNSYENN